MLSLSHLIISQEECNQFQIRGRTQAEHDKRLKIVLDRLVQAGVPLNYDKCSFSVEKFKFLGDIIDKDGIRQDPSKISVTKAVTALCDVLGVRRTLDMMINHVAMFVSHISTKTEPLRSLLSKNVEFQWNDRRKEVLKEIKDVLYSEVCLVKYNSDYDAILSADVSSFGLHAVLLQKQPCTEVQAVSYPLRALTRTEI